MKSECGILSTLDHRPYALPAGRWRLTQRWNDLLFAHWPVPVEAIARLLPAGLEADAFDGSAWVGVVPFWMDRVRTRIAGETTLGVPTTGTFPELNVRTYVRSRRTGMAGVFFFSLDAGSALAVLGARVLFHLPYHLATMSRVTTAAGVEYSSRRFFSGGRVGFQANYRPCGSAMPVSQPGSLAYFLTERYALFTVSRGRLLVGHVHHLPWPLQPAEAELRRNDQARAHGIVLPECAPVLYFARALEVFLWPLREELV